MKPEDIDKIFRERVGNAAPTPRADLWSRLQDRLEDEMPQEQLPFAKKAKEERKTFMWLYSSVAATLSLLLTVGVVFYNIKTTPEVNEHIVKAEQPVITETPVLSQPVPAATVAHDAIPENKSEVQATSTTPAASTPTEAESKPASIAKAVKASAPRHAAQVVAAEKPRATVQQAIATSNQTDKPVTAEGATAAALAVNTARSANLNAEPVEIIFKRGGAPQAAQAEPESEPSGFTKKTKLAKNIFKQVRNLANGEEVELQALGIRADKVALETQIGNRKLSKVINL